MLSTNASGTTTASPAASAIAFVVRAFSSSGTSGSGITHARNANTTSAPIRFAARIAALSGMATRRTIAASDASAMVANRTRPEGRQASDPGREPALELRERDPHPLALVGPPGRADRGDAVAAADVLQLGGQQRRGGGRTDGGGERVDRVGRERAQPQVRA